MKQARVDILVPYWGDFKLLNKAVDSVLAQTEENWRLLIVDDCYPSDEALKYFTGHQDKRISYLRNKKNLGLVRNFNYVLSKSNADYCVIFGCDDIMLPNYLERALDTIGDSDYYQPGVSIIDEADQIYLPKADRVKKLLRPKKAGRYLGEPIVSSLCNGNWLYFPSILWKRETLEKYKFDTNRPNTQDVTTELRILIDGGSLMLDNEITFLYRRSSESFSSKAIAGSRFEEELETYRDFSRILHEKGWRRASIAARLHITSRIHRITS